MPAISPTALSTLPALVRNQAKGGGVSEDTRAILAAASNSPEDAFGLLRSALGSLERHLSVTRADVLLENVRAAVKRRSAPS